MKDCDRCSRGVVREPLQMAEEIWGVCVYLLFTSVSFTEVSVSGKSSMMCGNYCLLISLKYRCGQLWSWTSVFCFGVCKRGECNHIKACGDVHIGGDKGLQGFIYTCTLNSQTGHGPNVFKFLNSAKTNCAKQHECKLIYILPDVIDW